MSQTLHQLYRKKAIVLARTMVIKFHSVATTINTDLIQRGYTVDENNPASWKYYMNMAGLYHQYDHDRLLELSDNTSSYIQIKVAGDNSAETSDFTKALLYGDSGDTTLANEYRFNTDYYNTLVAKYPEFEPLIAGILNPVSTDISVDAYDGEILYCGGYLKTLLTSGIYHYVRQTYGPITDTYQIEENEENLIPQLQEYVNMFVTKWYNANYIVTENLYQASFLATLYMSIPQIISNIRLGNAKTAYAHSFHIQEYLESSGRLGWVAPYLSKSVGIWLYRNLEWLDANRGKQKVFDAIVKNVLTPMNIPLTRYYLVHQTQDMSMQNIYPTVKMLKKPVNYSAATVSADYQDVSKVIALEKQLATDNYIDQSAQAEGINNQSKYGLFDQLPTRVFHSEVEDNSNRTPFTREEMGLNMWAFAAANGLYNGTVIFTNPLNNDRIQLTPLNAYILTLWCTTKALGGRSLDTIPMVVISRLPRSNTSLLGYPAHPTTQDVLKGVSTDYITVDQVNDQLGTYRVNYTHASSTSFSQEVTKAQSEAHRKYLSRALVMDALGNAMVEWVGHQCYWYQVPCALTSTKQNYADWFASHGVDPREYSDESLIALAYAIILAATGVDLDNAEELVDGQSAALTILKHFSPFTLQFIQESSGTSTVWFDLKNIRLRNAKFKPSAKWELSMSDVWVRIKGRVKQRIKGIFSSGGIKVNVTQRQRLKIRPTSDINVRTSGVSVRARFSGMSVASIRLPNIDMRDFTTTYTQYSSMPYPNYVGDQLSLQSMSNDKAVLVPPKVVMSDEISLISTLQNTSQLSPPKVNIEEQLVLLGETIPESYILPPVEIGQEQVKMGLTVKDAIIKTPETNGSDILTYQSTLQQLKLSPPSETHSESLSVTSSVGANSVITPPQTKQSDGISMVAASNNSATLTPPPPTTLTDSLVISSPTIDVQTT